MQQVLTIKLKILPDEAGKKLLEETMAAYSRACSFVAERIAEDHLPLNRCSIHKAVYRSCREQCPTALRKSADVKTTIWIPRITLFLWLSGYKVKKSLHFSLPRFVFRTVNITQTQNLCSALNDLQAQNIFLNLELTIIFQITYSEFTKFSNSIQRSTL